MLKTITKIKKVMALIFMLRPLIKVLTILKECLFQMRCSYIILLQIVLILSMGPYETFIIMI